MAPEKRQHSRQDIDLAAKLLHEPSHRFAQARTVDLSNGGALIEARLIRAIFPGDTVRIAIDWFGTGVVDANAMQSAQVIRADQEVDGTRRIALAFDRPIESRLAA